jgi:hypothetical protein
MQLRIVKAVYSYSSHLLSVLLAVGGFYGAPAVSYAQDVASQHRNLQKKSGDAQNSDVQAPLGTRFASKMAYYTDDDGLTVSTPIVSVTQKIFDVSSISLEYDADVLSAATIDVRSSATKKFEEVRHGLSVAGTHRFRESQIETSGAVSFSREADYTSLTLGGGLTQDLLQRSLTVGGGYSFVANAVGRAGTSYENFSESLYIHALSFSATQILTKTTYLQFSGSLIGAFGFQASVYRYVPIFLEGTLDPSLVNEANLLDGTLHPLSRPLEKLPQERFRAAGVVRLNHKFSWDMILRTDYRLYGDSWALMSHTARFFLYQKISDSFTLRLRDRYYQQSAASMYKDMYVVKSADLLPEYYTLDRELGTYWYNMAGLKLIYQLPSSDWYERLTVDIKGDVQHTQYSDFLYLDQRTAYIVGVGLMAEL